MEAERDLSSRLQQFSVELVSPHVKREPSTSLATLSSTQRVASVASLCIIQQHGPSMISRALRPPQTYCALTPSSTRILRSTHRTTKTVPAMKRKTVSNRREKTEKEGRVSRRVVVDCEGEEGSEMSEVRRYMACGGELAECSTEGERAAHHELRKEQQHEGGADARRGGFKDLRRGRRVSGSFALQSLNANSPATR